MTGRWFVTLEDALANADRTRANLDQHSGSGQMQALCALADRLEAAIRTALAEAAVSQAKDGDAS